MPRPPTVGGRADEVIRLPESPPERVPPNDHRGRRDSGRRAVPAGRALAVMLTCLFVWLLLDAPALKRAAEASPIGTRRSVSLAFLRPLAASSEFLQLDLVRGAIARAVGRSPEDEAGVASIAPVPVTSPGAGGSDQQSGGDAPLPAPTRGDPLRIAVVGDSFASGLGAALGRATNPHLVDVQSRGEISTGLTRPDYFNWESALRDIVSRFRPGVVVVMLGGNDGQTMTVPGGSSIPLSEQDQWLHEYSQRVEALIRTATDAGSRLVWVGLPPMRDINRDHQAHRFDDVYRQVSTSMSGAAYVNLLKIFARPGGGYSAYLPDESGKEQLVREADGEHFTMLGYDWVANQVIAALAKRWDLRPTAIAR